MTPAVRQLLADARAGLAAAATALSNDSECVCHDADEQYCEEALRGERCARFVGLLDRIDAALKAEDANAANQTVRLADVERAVNAACTCGGDGPGAGCPACEVWHALRAKMRARQAHPAPRSAP